MNYFVIGDEDTVLGFSLVGTRGMVAANQSEAQSAIQKALEQKEYGIIIITQDVANMIRPTVDRYLFSETFPLIVEIPNRLTQGKSKDLRALVNEAIGVAL
ncbi:MAG: V-type ATP synthase subunit F [Sphaerochaetaceae bacterium]|jgi:V/A-type H+-transporting ATPase subunit F|nr:V-type ATP synthase subunit F [Sphaerochaetaceae bacterium]MDX9809584.1 V-type ATP synthase subunit F [Sphaerochaetaceae bacterium]NLV84909.1 ATPase [Spirochaetales bacterium]